MTAKPTYEELEQKVKVLEELSANNKQVEESLQDTEKRYRLLFDHSPDGIQIIDPATAHFLDFNETAHLQLGYSREEFSQLSIFDLEANETPEETRSHMEYVIKHGISDFETRQRTKQGKIINLHVTAQYTEVLGKPVYHCIWRDITDRKRMEEELRENEEYTKSLFANSYIPLIVMDAETGIYIDCNAAAVQIYGYASREDVLGKTPLDVSTPIQYNGSDSATEAQKHIKIGREKGSHIFEWRHQRPNGQIWDAYVHLMLLQYRGKSLIQFMLQDITERKRIERALEESERRLADIIDFLPDATFAIDLSGKVIAWNQAIENMTGVKAEDILGKGDYEYAMTFYGMRRPMLIDLILGCAEDIMEKYDFVKREGNLVLAEGEVTLRGVPYTIWGKAGPLYDGKGNITGAIESIRDVTELKKTQDALQKAHDELEAKVRERTTELKQANRALQTEISVRKLAEVVLKESEEKYRQFFKTSRDFIFVTSKDGKIVDMNDAALELFGYASLEELRQVKVPDLYVQPEEREELYNKVLECGYAKEYPVDLCRKDGNIRHTLITAVGQYDANGRLTGLQGTIRDITDRKLAEEALRESETKYRRLHESMTEAFASVDMNGRIQESNRAFQSMLGYTEEELRHLTCSDITPEKWYAFEKNIVEEQILVQGHADIYEKEYQRKDGSVFPIELSTFLIRDDAGNPAGMWSIVHDITERKSMEIELRATKDYLRTVFNNVYDAILIHDLDGKILDVNDKMLEMYRVSREEAIALNVLRDYSVTDESMEESLAIWNKIVSGENIFVEWKARRPKDSSVFDVEVFLTKLVLPDGDYILSNVRDVTKRKHIEEELRKYRENLEVMVAERTSELEEKTKNLQEVNTALNVLLKKREEDKKILEERFVANIGSLVLPYLEKIKKNNLDMQQQFCLDTIEKNLDEIASPLLENIQKFDLTPREFQVASLIKDGKTTKEIANLLGIAKGSIDTHRKNIRKKLHLDRTSNLQSNLLFLEK